MSALENLTVWYWLIVVAVVYGVFKALGAIRSNAPHRPASDMPIPYRARVAPASGGFGHAIFWLLHIVAVLFGVVWLVITIPAHLIYCAVVSRGRVAESEVVTDRTHTRCPKCRELVRVDASLCKHCHTALEPRRQGG